MKTSRWVIDPATACRALTTKTSARHRDGMRRAVGGEADGGSARRAGAARVGEIGGHAGDDVALFSAKVALQLDDGGAPRDVDAAAVVDEVALVLKLAERGAEALAQQLRDQTTQCLVPRPGGHRSDDLGQAFPAPTGCHLSTPTRGHTVAAAIARA